jgi:uncharacterized membrane protein
MKILFALPLFLLGLALAAAAALTVYFRDPLKTTAVLGGSAALLLGAAVWLARGR